jgi:hypothetical protein
MYYSEMSKLYKNEILDVHTRDVRLCDFGHRYDIETAHG